MPKASPESPRMFESDFADYFSRTHPAVVPILFVPAVGMLLAWSALGLKLSAAQNVALAAAGLVSWTLVEYWLHRLFFHWQPRAWWGDRMHFLVHGVHHRWPTDKYRLVMPPAVSITLFVLFLALWYGLLGRFGWAFHAGFVSGYMFYDLTHYYLHHFQPKSAYGKRLKRHHMLHHFQRDDANFGVSVRFWDLIFGTVASRAARASATPQKEAPPQYPTPPPPSAPHSG